MSFYLCLLAALLQTDPKKQPEKQDPLAKYKNKDVIVVILTNGSSFKGVVSEETANTITLDLSVENPRLKGTITIEKSMIKSQKASRKLDEKAIAKLRAEQEMVKKALEQANIDRTKRISDEDKERIKGKEKADKEKENEKKKTEIELAMEQLKKLEEGNKLLEKFPPEIWGPKYLELTKPFDPVKGTAEKTPEEKEFLEKYETWKFAKDHNDKQNQKLVEGRKLLKEFDPEDGWTEAKWKELDDKLTKGEKLGEEQARFYKNIELWRIAKEEKDKLKPPEEKPKE